MLIVSTPRNGQASCPTGCLNTSRWNQDEMIKDLAHEEETQGKQIENHKQDTKVLCMRWKTERSILRFKMKRERVDYDLLDGTKTPTKRIVLSTMMNRFNPLGLLGFFTLKGKLVVKLIWKTQVDWDVDT